MTTLSACTASLRPSSVIETLDSLATSGRLLWKLSGTQLAMSSSYHPQTDGQTENVNRAVQDILRAYVKDNRKDWDRHLTAVEIAINSSRHASTGYTPHFLSHNQEMRLPFGIALKEAMASAKVPAAVSALSDMAANDETARTQMAEAQAQQEKAANRHRREESYAVGDQVMLNTKHLAGYKHKLACRFIGPFAVVAAGIGNVTLDLPADMRIHDVVNVDRVKRYVPSVGEWPGRLQHSRPLPVRVAEDGTGEYEVEALLGKKEGLENPPDDESEAGKRKKEVMVVRYLVLWKGYSMDDCSWERDTNLAGANGLGRRL